MSERIPILVCGDVGPARHALLARDDLNLVRVESVDGALAAIRFARPRACVTRAQIDRGSALIILDEISKRGGVPVLVLILPHELRLRAQCLAAGAADVVEIHRADAVLRFIAAHAGVEFAEHPRAPYETSVRVLLNGHDHLAHTTDLSAGGVAVRGLAAAQQGTLASVTFTSEAGAPTLWARVVRAWTGTGGEPLTGLQFVGTTDSERAWLSAIVQAHARTIQPDSPYRQLFDGATTLTGEAEPLATMDIRPPPDISDQGSDSSAEDLRALRAFLFARLGGALDVPVTPAWLERLAMSLTECELEQALGTGRSEWAEQALDMRIRLARARTELGQAPLPHSIAEQAYDLFLSLRHSAVAETERVAAQIAIVRGAILRDILSAAPSTPSAEPDHDHDRDDHASA